jgi:hypothetical protein
MGRLYWSIALLVVLVPAIGVSQDEVDLRGDPEYAMELDQRALELEQQRAEMEFQRQKQELELEEIRLELEHQEKHDDGGGAVVLLILCGVVHILLAVWVYQDIRARNAGSGLWVVLVLLAGLLAALVYAVVRLGDIDNGKKRTTSR